MILFASAGMSPTTSRGTTVELTSSEPMRGLFVTVSAKEAPSEVQKYFRKQLTQPQVP